MPRKPLKPCKYPRCPNLSEQTYCPIHRKSIATEQNRTYNENVRDKEMQKFYDSTAWRGLRQLKIKQSPLCEKCLLCEKIVSAVIVDHILPAKEYPSKRLDMDNLQSLCTACHNKKTATDKAQGVSNPYHF